jgi:hypothetical protein
LVLLDPPLFVFLDPRRAFERCCAISCSFRVNRPHAGWDYPCGPVGVVRLGEAGPQSLLAVRSAQLSYALRISGTMTSPTTRS